jgi:spore germination protein KC
MLFSLSGCWNYREVDSMAMVSGFAVDKGQTGYKYHITYEFLDFSGKEMKSKIVETEGDTIFDCVRNAVGKIEKKLYFSDCKIVIISKDIASEGINPIMDWLIRDQEPRIDLNLVISEEKTAADIIEQKPMTNPLVSIELWHMIEKNKATLAEAPDVKLYKANNLLADDCCSLILPSLKISKDSKEKTIEFGGTAIFKKDKLIGFLNRSETKYLLFIKNQIQGGLLVTSLENNTKDITLEINGNQTTLTPSMTNKGLSVDIGIDLKATLGENNGNKIVKTNDDIREVEQSAKKTLEYGVSTLFKKVQSQYDSDIFGVASTIHRMDPQTWSKLKPDWDKTFKELKFTISDNVTITNTAIRKTKGKE